MNDHPLFGKEKLSCWVYKKERTVCHQLSQQPDTYQLVHGMLAASSIRIDGPFLLVPRLFPLPGPGLVSGPADGRCHGSDGGWHFAPLVHGSVAPGVNCAPYGYSALILHSQGETKLSESGILLLQDGLNRLEAIQHSLVF